MYTDEMRWKQRLENYEKALVCLEDACNRSSYTQLEQAGLAQTFEFTFELAWKTLKNYLFVVGFTVNSPRDAIKKAFEAELLDEDDTETLLTALDKRNLLSHTYDESAAELAVLLIKNEFAPVLSRLHATLNSKKNSGRTERQISHGDH